MGVNEYPADQQISYRVTDLQTDEVLLEGCGLIPKNGAAVIGSMDAISRQTMLLITYSAGGKKLKNHYLTGIPTYDYAQVVHWFRKAELLTLEGF